MCWYCELAAKCITVLLPPTGEILERLDLLEHAALFKSDCCCFFIGSTQCKQPWNPRTGFVCCWHIQSHHRYVVWWIYCIMKIMLVYPVKQLLTWVSFISLGGLDKNAVVFYRDTEQVSGNECSYFCFSKMTTHLAVWHNRFVISYCHGKQPNSHCKFFKDSAITYKGLY